MHRPRSALALLGAVLALAQGCVGAVEGGGPSIPSDPDASVAPDAAAPSEDGGAPAEDASVLPPPDIAPECPRVRTTTVGLPLNIRSTPSTDGAIVGTLPEGSMATVIDIVEGEAVDGNTTWYEIDDDGTSGYVAGRWAECTTDEPPPPPPPDDDGFYLPLRCGRSARISQGNDSGFSHSGYSRYAFDFAIPRGTPLRAMRAGTVIRVYTPSGPGDPCYDGGGPGCITEANLVWVRHGDGTVTSYAHLDSAAVSRGDRVARGDVVGRSGSSGYSTGPHAHVARQTDCGAIGCQSIRMRFQDVAGDGIPETGDTVTSGNCP